MRVYLELFQAFFCIGLFTFGGGYAMLPMLQREVVERHGWTAGDELLDCFAVAQCTPGIIAVNTATYVGYKVKKIPGSLVATTAIVFPSLIIITILATVLNAFSGYAIVAHAFAGIRVAVAVLVLKALVNLYKKGVKGALANGIFVVSILAAILTDVSPVILVAAAVLLGILLRKVGKDQ